MYFLTNPFIFHPPSSKLSKLNWKQHWDMFLTWIPLYPLTAVHFLSVSLFFMYHFLLSSHLYFYICPWVIILSSSHKAGVHGVTWSAWPIQQRGNRLPHYVSGRKQLTFSHNRPAIQASATQWMSVCVVLLGHGWQFLGKRLYEKERVLSSECMCVFSNLCLWRDKRWKRWGKHFSGRHFAHFCSLDTGLI